MSGIDEEVSNFDVSLAESENNKNEKMDRLREVNNDIRFADRNQRILGSQLDEIVSFRGKV